MSDRVKAKIGEELYNQVLAKGIKASEFDLLDGYIPRDRYNTKNEELKTVKAKIETYEQQLEETKNLLEGSQEFETKYNDLNEKYKTDLENKDIEMTNYIKKNKLVNSLLEHGAKHPELIVGQVNLEDLTVDGDNVLGLDKIVQKAKTDYSDLFTEKINKSNSSGQSGNDSSNNDFSNDGDGDDNWDDIFADL